MYATEIANKLNDKFRGLIFGLHSNDKAELSKNNTLYIGKCLSRNYPLAQKKLVLVTVDIESGDLKELKQKCIYRMENVNDAIRNTYLFPSQLALECHVFNNFEYESEEIEIENALAKLASCSVEATINPDNYRLTLSKDICSQMASNVYSLVGTKLYLKITSINSKDKKGKQQ